MKGGFSDRWEEMQGLGEEIRRSVHRVFGHMKQDAGALERGRVRPRGISVAATAPPRATRPSPLLDAARKLRGKRRSAPIVVRKRRTAEAALPQPRGHRPSRRRNAAARATPGERKCGAASISRRVSDREHFPNLERALFYTSFSISGLTPAAPRESETRTARDSLLNHGCPNPCRHGELERSRIRPGLVSTRDAPLGAAALLRAAV